MEIRDVFIVALPFIVSIVLGVGFLFVFRERAAAREVLRRRALAEPDLATPLRDPHRPERAWWGNPWLWVVVCLVSVLLGIFVWPGLFGVTFLFLPFIWVWRPRRGRDVDPRTNGHGSRVDPGSLGG
jgi:ABC-type Fe3+ transport system permease subunit